MVELARGSLLSHLVSVDSSLGIFSDPLVEPCLNAGQCIYQTRGRMLGVCKFEILFTSCVCLKNAFDQGESGLWLVVLSSFCLFLRASHFVHGFIQLVSSMSFSSGVEPFLPLLED